jgi:hypothetical protein
MNSSHMESEAALEMLERRWFATFKAASAARAECEALLETMESTEAAWKRARVRLAELESVRDALGEELAHLDAAAQSEPRRRPAGAVCSAA